jgi:hypothetical protein
MAENMHESKAAKETAVPETDHAYPTIDRREPGQDQPSSDSIARAQAAQQRERAAFTKSTGVGVNTDGRMLGQRVIRDTRARTH